MTIDLEKVPGIDKDIVATLNKTVLRVPVTQTVIYGWYDNEMGSYVNMLGDRVVSIAEDLIKYFSACIRSSTQRPRGNY